MFNLLNNIRVPETAAQSKGDRKNKMNLPGKKKLGIAAIIVAALVGVAVPFVFLHGTSPQGKNPTTTTGGNNGNNGSKTAPGSGGNSGGTNNSGNSGTTTGGTGDSSRGSGSSSDSGSSSGSGSTGTCNETKTHDHDHDTDPQTNGNGEHNGNAWGVIKNRMDTTTALVKAMGAQDPAYHLHHDTDTDNDTAHGPHFIHDPSDHDSSCAADEESHDHD
jgi:hypothetical protein